MPGSAAWSLALRYLRPRRSLVSAITFMSVLGPILGVAVLIIVISVMGGFSKDIRERILGMQAHIQITDPLNGVIRDPANALEALSAAGLAAAPVIEGPVLIQTKREVTAKYVKGILPAAEKTVSDIHQHVDYEENFDIAENEILIGREMAFMMDLRVGQKILVHSPDKLTKMVDIDEDGNVTERQDREVYVPEELTIAGIFNMGMYDYDSGIIIMHIDKAADLFGMPWGAATSLQVKTADPFALTPIVEQLRRDDAFHGLRIITWEQANERLFGALAVEKNLMFFLLVFIVLVAAFGIAGTLITVVIQKTREIGVLKALGASPSAILGVFLWQGAIVGFLGTAGGTILGRVVLKWRNEIAELLRVVFKMEIFPKQLYHLSGIPAEVNTADLVLIASLSFALCVGASLFPAIYAACMQPSEALRTEGA